MTDPAEEDDLLDYGDLDNLEGTGDLLDEEVELLLQEVDGPGVEKPAAKDEKAVKSESAGKRHERELEEGGTEEGEDDSDGGARKRGRFEKERVVEESEDGEIQGGAQVYWTFPLCSHFFFFFALELIPPYHSLAFISYVARPKLSGKRKNLSS